MKLDMKHVNECYDDEENEKLKRKASLNKLKYFFLDRYGSHELTRFHFPFIRFI